MGRRRAQPSLSGPPQFPGACPSLVKSLTIPVNVWIALENEGLKEASGAIGAVAVQLVGGRYLVNSLRETFGLIRVLIRLSMRSGGQNPHAPKKRRGS
jgi:hypothetical protein